LGQSGLFHFKYFMKYFLIGVLIGVALTASVGISLYYLSDNTEALATLDMLIDEWTRSDVAVADSSLLFHSQLPAAKELPNARPGFFPDTVIALSHRLQSLYQIPKGVVLAQWALESSWGRNNLGVSNYFGHTFAATKRFMSNPRYVMRSELIHTAGQITSGKPTSFSAYSSIAECFDVHGQYLSRSPLYVNAFKQQSPEAFAREIAKRYATDPDYALKLIAIMRRYKL